MDSNQFSQDPSRINGTAMARLNKKLETFGDDEFDQAMEEALREDRELLKKLAKI